MSTQITIASKLPYKSYVALLTQSGGDNQQNIAGGDLTIGVTYRIGDQAGGNWDFTNVGAPNNNIDTYFVATGTTPNSWGNGTLIYNTGAPVVTVLENTIGAVTWVYGSAGYYLLQLTGAFPPLKTFCPIVVVSNAPEFATNYGGKLDNIEILTSGDNILSSTPIEIRVYN